MSLTQEDVKKIAHLARLNLSEEELVHFTPQLTGIFKLVEQMSQVNSQNILPLAHPLEASQRLREDVVTETNQRELNQSIAPQVEAGLYLVPKVIDAE